MSVWWTCVPDDEGRTATAQLGGNHSIRLTRPTTVSEEAWCAWLKSLVASLEAMGESVHRRTLAEVERAMMSALPPSIDGVLGARAGDV